MPNLTIPLVTDPELRESLRNLYPDVPMWAREWLIPTPGAPLAPPPLRPQGDRTRTDVLLTELQATCAAVNATHPSRPWVVQREGAFAWIGPAGCTRKDRVTHPQAEGRVVSLAAPPSTRARRPSDRALNPQATRLTIQEHGGHLFLSLEPGVQGWSFERGDMRCAGVVRAREHIAFRQVYLRHNGEATPVFAEAAQAAPPSRDPAPAYKPGENAVILLADGTYELTLTRGRVTPWQVVDPDENVDALTLEISRLELLRRWRNLPSDVDRARVATYWLGHPHPILAELGMRVFSAIQLPTTPLPTIWPPVVPIPSGRRGHA